MPAVAGEQGGLVSSETCGEEILRNAADLLPRRFQSGSQMWYAGETGYVPSASYSSLLWRRHVYDKCCAPPDAFLVKLVSQSFQPQQHGVVCGQRTSGRLPSTHLRLQHKCGCLWCGRGYTCLMAVLPHSIQTRIP